jgi:hypothetical protein
MLGVIVKTLLGLVLYCGDHRLSNAFGPKLRAKPSIRMWLVSLDVRSSKQGLLGSKDHMSAASYEKGSQEA